MGRVGGVEGEKREDTIIRTRGVGRIGAVLVPLLETVGGPTRDGADARLVRPRCCVSSAALLLT